MEAMLAGRYQCSMSSFWGPGSCIPKQNLSVDPLLQKQAQLVKQQKTCKVNQNRVKELASSNSQAVQRMGI